MEKKIKLTKEEKDIENAVNREEFVSVKNLKKERNKYARVARNTLAKNKTISIRISERDLLRLKAKAAEEGMPYQTLISSSLHKLVISK